MGKARKHRATHIPQKGNVHVRMLILVVLILAAATIALGFIVVLGATVEANASQPQPWHPPLLTDQQWSTFHKGPRP